MRELIVRFRIILVAALFLMTFVAGLIVARSGLRITSVEETELEERFTHRMKNVALVGHFTIGATSDLEANPERYEIESVTKVGEDAWRFMARITYGNVDLTLPVTVPVVWAGDTPMVTLTDFSIPTLGTFTSRVIFYGDRYAGTWQHGEFGGHMFGRIEKIVGS